MNMPKIPFLIEQHSRFAKALSNLSALETGAKFLSHTKLITGVPEICTVDVLQPLVSEMVNIVRSIDDVLSDPCTETNFSDITGRLLMQYDDILKAGEAMTDMSADPRALFDFQAYMSILDQLFTVFSFCEINERSSMCKMLRGNATLLLNGGLLTSLFTIGQYVLSNISGNNPVESLEIYANGDTVGYLGYGQFSLEYSKEQLFFTDEERQAKDEAEARAAEAEECARNLEAMKKSVEEFTTNIFAAIEETGDDIRKFGGSGMFPTPVLGGTLNFHNTQQECEAIVCVAKLLFSIATHTFGVSDDSHDKYKFGVALRGLNRLLTGGGDLYCHFGSGFGPKEVAIALNQLGADKFVAITQTRDEIIGVNADDWKDSTVSNWEIDESFRITTR